MEKNILVTGGAGYIGSHTAKMLKKAGFNPITIDNLSCGHEYAVKWGAFIKGDVADEKVIRETVKKYNISAIIHFAALTLVKESVVDPIKYYENNVTKTLALLKTALDCGMRYFIFSSSCAVYGAPQKIPIEENDGKFPVNPYGQTKLFVENILKDLEKPYNLKSAILRYFNAAGADLDGEIGEDHLQETHLIPLIMQTLLGRQQKLQLFGNDFPTPDGTAIRDYIHVNDLAMAHVLALKYLLNNKSSIDINLGTGIGHSVLEIIRTVEAETSLKVPFDIAPKRIGDPPVLVASNEKAQRLIAWKPSFSLKEIIKSAWSWHNKQEQL